MSSSYDELTHEDKIAAIQSYVQDILSLVSQVDAYGVTSVMLELENLKQYVESQLDFETYMTPQPNQRSAA